MSVDELLAQLKDITEPSAPAWWPLAPGWWILLALLLFIAITLYFLSKRKAAYRPFVSAYGELQRIKNLYLKDKDVRVLAFALSEWLKRVALFAYPDKQLAGLTGQAWLEFLDQSAGNTHFTQGPGQVFSQAIYDNRSRLDGAQLLELCERWLIAVKPQLIGQDAH